MLFSEFLFPFFSLSFFLVLVIGGWELSCEGEVGDVGLGEEGSAVCTSRGKEANVKIAGVTCSTSREWWISRMGCQSGAGCRGRAS